MEGISVDISYLELELRLVRRRLGEHIEAGALLQPDDLVPLHDMISLALEAIDDAKAWIHRPSEHSADSPA